MQLDQLTFMGGVHMEDYKSLSNGAELKILSAPEEVTMVLSQHIGKPAKALVKKGDRVLLGQKIAEADGFVSAPVHASAAGEVKAVIDYRTAVGSKVKAIVIKNDFSDELGYETVDRSGEDLSSEEIIKYIQDAGIVGMGGAGFPTHVKLSPPKDSSFEYLVMNGAECEPYLTCDEYLMRNMPEKLIRGLELAMKASKAKQAFIAIEDNKPMAIEAMQKALANRTDINLAVMKTKYPQGDERRIVDAVLGKKIAPGAIPASVGAVIINTATANAIVDAVDYGKPLYERVVTVTGHAVNEPGNFVARIGSRIIDLVEQAGGYAEEPGKIIFGGPMMGVSQYSDQLVTDKRNNGVLVMTRAEAGPRPISPCIRCGRCVEVCPVFLEPLYIATASKKEKFDIAESYHINNCIECGSCTYICPANRPLMELIKFGKAQIRSMAKK